MRRLLVCVALGIAAPIANAQRPDFSGTWVSDSAAKRSNVAATGDAPFQRGEMGTGWGSPLTLTQRADSLIVEYIFFSTYDLQPPVRLAFALDGRESRNDVMIGHATAAQRSSLQWSDSAVVVSTTHLGPDGKDFRVQQRIELASPTSLIITTARENGTSSRTYYTNR